MQGSRSSPPGSTTAARFAGAARVPAQVRHVPLVLPRAGAAGRASRRLQVFVV